MKYPECEKMKKVREQSQAIGEFLEWLQNERDIVLAMLEEIRKENNHG